MPIPKILLPVDIQHPHEEVVDQLDALLKLAGVKVHLLYVKDELPAYEQILGTMADFPDDWKNELGKKINEVLDQLKLKLQQRGADVTTEVVSGPAAMMIEAVARDEGFEMVAMMPGSHSRVQQYLIGSTASRVVGHAPGTVLILRQSAATLKNVVIGIDGSDASLRAAKSAVQLFQLTERDVQITLVNVVSVTGIFKFISLVRFVAAVEDNLVMSGEAALTDAQNQLSEMGLKSIDFVLKNGEPADEILKVADSLNAQLIVIGAQGRSAVEKFLIGSVSSRISTYAKCSTAVIK